MIDRILLRLLSLVLFLWQPAAFASELLTTLPSIGMRGTAAVLELMAHGGVAAVSVAAAWSLRARNHHGPLLARIALVGLAVVSIQTLYWTVLPTQTRPGTELPLASIAALHALAWIAYLHRSSVARQFGG